MDAPRATRSPTGAILHICPACAGRLVYPIAWERRQAEHWEIERRCPDCEWRGRDEHTLSEVDDYDEVLNDGTEALLAGLRALTRTNMEEAVETLVAAIHCDGVQPMDF